MSDPKAAGKVAAKPEDGKKVKKPSKVAQLIDFLTKLGADKAHTVTVEKIVSELKMLRFIKGPKVKLDEVLNKHEVAFCKVVFMTEAAQIPGVSDMTAEKLAGIAAERELKPESTKLWKVRNNLGVETIRELYNAFVIANYAKLAKKS